MFTNINQRPSVFFIFLLNLVPIWGVIHWGWTPFYVFYLFWLETLVVSIFNAIKIIACRGDEYDVKLHSSNHKFADIHVNHWSHIGKALRYFFIRLAIFFFYLIFIVVFIGFFASNKTGGSGLSILNVIIFRNETFNYTLLAFILNQVGQLIFDFYSNGDYKKVHPSDFASIFDGRQLVVHVAVVLGGVIGAQGKIFNTKIEPNYVAIIVVSIFCVVKSIYEVFIFKQQQSMIEERQKIPAEAIQ
ncbi:DUF6498-containing protein [Ferruginibacter lapsinanis]|uniref:DUF6498-containing protein n=1 Tax=Ferruginibacter lapsinanis TaxID=563172 RepID=UPI001E591AE9|nr:DUF6498-containing protein [Ferruginibacter lapsinanis]UEG49818.1 DUF6498-containing protein [Ferruginibacter lapsinanis]